MPLGTCGGGCAVERKATPKKPSPSIPLPAEGGRRADASRSDHPFRRKGEEERMLRGAIIPSAERGKKSGCFAERSPLPQKGGRRASASRAITPSVGRGRRACHSARAAGDALLDEEPSPQKAIPLVALRARSLSLRPSCGRGKKSETLRARSLRSALRTCGRGRKSERFTCDTLGHGSIFGRPARQPAVTIIYRAGH